MKYGIIVSCLFALMLVLITCNHVHTNQMRLTATDANEPAPRGFSPMEIRKADSLVKGFMVKYQVPGLSFTIAQHDSIKIQRCYGVADTAKHELMTPAKLCRIASLSKTFTSVSIMKLVEAGKLKLNDKVFGKGAILGTTYGTYPYRKYVEEITVEDLMECLVGGWPTDGDPDPLYLRSDLDRDHLISWTLDNIPLRDKPGTHYNYSSFGFCLLGRVIEKVSGISYEDFVRQNVLAPCGITAMRIGANPESGRVNDEMYYYDWNPKENPYTIGDVPLRDSAGGWIASPTDLVKFLTHLDNFPEQPELLTRTTLDTMFSPPPINPGYAKGWIKNTDNDALSIGVMPGQGSAMCLEKEGFAWAALVNRRFDDQMSSNLFRLMWELRRTIKHWPNVSIEN